MVPLDDEMSIKSGNAGISSEKVASSIAELKVAARWPKKLKTPAFNDEAATVYMNIVPKKLDKSWFSTQPTICLPHPLSLDRSLCFVSEDNETKEEKEKNTQKYRELGVTGKIKMIPKSLLVTAMASDARDAFCKMVKPFDTRLISNKAHKQSKGFLKDILMEDNNTWLSEGKMSNGVTKTVMIANVARDGFSIAVGHKGHTNQQLQENILAVNTFVCNQLRRMFPSGSGSIKSVQLKTGTTEGVTMMCDDSEEQGYVTDEIVPAVTIAEGLTALKAFVDWPKEPMTPAYTDKAATVYLKVTLWKKVKFDKRNIFVMTLRHPLSLDRAVCYVSEEASEEEETKNTEELRALGVTGEIKMMSKSEVETAFADKDFVATADLVSRFDTHVVDFDCAALHAELVAQRKMCSPKDKGFAQCLRRTAMWPSSNSAGRNVAVGHIGLTDQQLLENIAAAMVYIDKKIPNVKSIKLKTGLTEGITVRYGVSADQDAAVVEEESAPAVTVTIAEGIAALMAAADWPNEQKTPEYNDDAATVFLDITPKKMVSRVIPRATELVRLPHALSLNRRVCYVSQNVDGEEQQAANTQKLRDLGVTGKIKMIPKSLLGKAFANKAKEALEELADIYDTYLACPWGVKTVNLAVAELLRERRKFCVLVKDECFENTLKFSALWPNASKNGYVIAVGHTGLTDEQLGENVAAAVSYVDSLSRLLFPDGLASVESMRLKTGTGEGVAVHWDSSALQAKKKRKAKRAVEEQCSSRQELKPVSAKKRRAK